MTIVDSGARRRAVARMQYDDLEQQKESGLLGMWIFLATEVMFFGALLTAYTVLRHVYHDAFAHASQHLDMVLGTAMTGILLCSSTTMAMSIHAAYEGHRKKVIFWLVLTAILGVAFLALKGTEYAQKFEDSLVPGWSFSFPAPWAGQAELFFVLYFILTLLHAVHLTIGIGVVCFFIYFYARRPDEILYPNRIETAGLYWHLVDIVWIFLFPLLYLVERSL